MAYHASTNTVVEDERMPNEISVPGPVARHGLPRFDEWVIFARVAALSSFSAAARELGVSSATISKAMTRLESEIGSALFHRTTRTLSLTDTGQTLFPRAMELLSAGEDIELLARGGANNLLGKVRISAPMSFGMLHVAPLVALIMAEHPGIVIELHLSDGPSDLVGEGFDIGLKIGWPRDSTLLARKLADIPNRIVAAPSYVEKHGAPAEPSELDSHRCVSYAPLLPADQWRLVTGGHEERFSVNVVMLSNSAEAMMTVVRSGNGIAMIPGFLVEDLIEAGELVDILPDWHPPVASLYLMTPSSGPRPARVTTVLEYLAKHVSARLLSDGAGR